MKKLSYIISATLASAVLAGCGGGATESSSVEASSESSVAVSSESSVVASSESSVAVSSESSAAEESSVSSVAESSSSAAATVFELTSPSFNAGDALGAAYTCEGKTFFDGTEILPELTWSAGPEGTQSYAVVFKDMTIVQGGGNVTPGYHWAMLNIPADVTSLPEGMAGGDGGISGASQYGGTPSGGAYLGPCPNYDYCQDNTRENHEYAFVVYALDQASISPGQTDVLSIDNLLIESSLESTEILVTSDAAANAECGGSTETGSSSSEAASSSSSEVASSSSSEAALVMGQALYADACQGCHGASKQGASFDRIKSAIDENRGGMGFLNTLTDEQIQSLADI